MDVSSMSDLQAIADAWNAEHPIGTAVIRTDDDGCKHPTKTRSFAEVLGGHTAVIWLDHVTGCYDLSRVEAV